MKSEARDQLRAGRARRTVTETEVGISAQKDVYFTIDGNSGSTALAANFVTQSTWIDIWENTEDDRRRLMHHDILTSGSIDHWGAVTSGGDRVFFEYRLIRIRGSVYRRCIHRNHVYVRNLQDAVDTGDITRRGTISLEAEVPYQANDTVKLQVKTATQIARGTDYIRVLRDDAVDTEFRNSVLSYQDDSAGAGQVAAGADCGGTFAAAADCGEPDTRRLVSGKRVARCR